MNSTELIAQADRRYKEIDGERRCFEHPSWTNGYIQGWLENLKHEDKHVAGQVLEDILAERNALQAEVQRLSVLATRYSDECMTAELAYEFAVDKATEFESKWRTAEAERDKLQAENLELDETCGKRQVRIYELEAENKRLKERVAELEAFAEPILRTYEEEEV